MYSCLNETAEFLTQLCSIYKKKTFKIFSIEMEKYSFGNKYNEAKNVYANKNGDYGYYESTDFKEIVIVLKKGINYLHLITNEEEKKLFKAFLLQGTKLRNDVWHNKIDVNNMEKNYNQVLILQKLVDIIKKEKYINKKNVGTKSYKVGHGEQEYFGYGDGALPLVLSHNTPNNSILVLWQDDDDHYPSLFPRINRH